MARAEEERILTADDVLAMPDDNLRHELVTGQLVSEPPASFGHGAVAGNIFHLLSVFVRKRKLGRVLSADTGFLLARSPDTLRVPDVAFVSTERIRLAGNVKGFFPGAPDLAVEVLSPSDRPDRIHAKIADYLASGSRLVWIIDPVHERVIVHRLLLSQRILHRDDTLEAEDILPGFSVSVAGIFDPES